MTDTEPATRTPATIVFAQEGERAKYWYLWPILTLLIGLLYIFQAHYLYVIMTRLEHLEKFHARLVDLDVEGFLSIYRSV